MTLKQVASFVSRYNQTRTVFRAGRDEYIIEGASAYIRYASESGSQGYSMVDYDGGPYIAIGMSASVAIGVRSRRKIVEIHQLPAEEGCARMLVCLQKKGSK